MAWIADSVCTIPAFSRAAGDFHSWSVPVGIDRVFLASAPLPRRDRKGRISSHDSGGIKEQLANYLLKKALSGNLCPHDHSLTSRLFARVSITRDTLGKPLISSPTCLGVHLSFSHGLDRLWAAVVRSPRSPGIDAAHPSEFGGAYPFHQAFHQQEWSMALETLGQETSDAAALLWSLKEAAVKSLGCGFHLLGPRELLVAPWELNPGSREFRVRIIHLEAPRAGVPVEPEIRATATRYGDAWIAVAMCGDTAPDVLGHAALHRNECPP